MRTQTNLYIITLNHERSKENMRCF